MTERGAKRILVIDDDKAIHADFRKILCPPRAERSLSDAESALFGSDGGASEDPGADDAFEVDIAAQGQEGYEMLNRALEAGRPYSVAIVDMRMPPGWDGLETIEHLWQSDARLQVVLCTAYSDYSWEEVASRLGRAENLLVLKKPVDPVEVWQLVRSLAEKWLLREAQAAELRQSERLSRELQASNERLQREISDREVAQKESTRDELTGLANRRRLLQIIDGCIERQRRDASARYAVLFLDVDNFKLVNDVFGHAVGDQLLVHVSERLKGCLLDFGLVSERDEQVIGRIGGDEFVIVLDRMPPHFDCMLVAKALLRRLSGVFDLGAKNPRVKIGASIGIAIGGPSYSEAEDLLRDADVAMYRAKNAGKSRAEVFDPQMRQETALRLQIETGLREAIERGDFRVVYQPIVELPSRRLKGFEALLRWDRGPDGGRSPDVFVPVAEESGLIVPIGRWMLDAAVKQIAAWRELMKDVPGAYVSVNVSRLEIADDGFVAGVRGALGRFELPGSCLNLEVTERGVIDDVDLAAERLAELRKLGVGLFMDDFGTGTSSLGCLNRLPFDVVKIDRSFIADMSRGSRSAMIKAVVAMAGSLGMKALIEGVETEDQCDLVTRLGCNYAQGYLFSRPVDADQATMMLREGLKPAEVPAAPARA